MTVRPSIARPSIARPSIALCVSGLLLVGGGCRTVVQLEAPHDAAIVTRDAGRDAGSPIDARAIDAAREDVGIDALVPPRACEGGGLALGPVASVAPARAPQLLALGAGPDARWIVLVPPTEGTSTGRLVVLDRDAHVRTDRALDVTGGAAVVALPSASSAPGEAAFLLALADQLWTLDVEGADVGTPRAMAPPLGAALAGATALLDDTHLVYVAEDGAIVSRSLDTGESTVSATTLVDGDTLFVDRGAIVVNRAGPAPESWELTPTLDGERVRLSFTASEFAGRVLGATYVGAERRWVARGAGEFRAQTQILVVRDDGTTSSLDGELLIGPLVSSQRDGLVAVSTTDGAVTVFEPATATHRPLLTAGPRSLASVARADGELLLLTLEAGDPDPQLVLRCGL